MSIQGIDSITYGVEDLVACRRFFLDWGLQLEREAQRRLEFATLNGCQVVVADQNDPVLPPAIEPRPTIRDMDWGADSESDIAYFEKSLAGAPSYFARGGEVGCVDPNGTAIRVRVSQKRSLD